MREELPRYSDRFRGDIGDTFSEEELEEEVWAKIPGFPNYAVSDLGRVKNIKIDRIMKLNTDPYGVKRVTLYDAHGKNRCRTVSRLVAQVFLTGYSEDQYVKHFDGNNGNNRIKNLVYNRGRGVGQRRKNPDRPFVRRVVCVETGQTFRTAYEAARYLKLDVSNIYRVLRGDRKSHGGYTFDYVDYDMDMRYY